MACSRQFEHIYQELYRWELKERAQPECWVMGTLEMPGDGKEEAFEIRYQECGNYLHAFISGKEDSADSAFEYWHRIIDECHKRGFKALLVEENFPNQVSTIDMFTVTSAIPDMGSRDLKIAFVDDNAEHSDLNTFGETVAVNRGMFGQVFSTLEEAAAWLKS